MSDADDIRRAYARREKAIDPERYSLRHAANTFARRERELVLRSALERRGLVELATLDILEVGCGAGGELEWLIGLGADPRYVHGIDLRPEAVETARARVPGVSITTGDATALPYSDASFDLVYQATALSSMHSSSMRSQVAAEMRRVARPGGVIVSYDFAWNPLNRDTVGIPSSELRRLFPGLAIEIHRVTLAPPIGRWLGRRSLNLLRLFTAIPWLRSHRLAVFDVPA